jgi:hypothetical protein
MTKNKIIKNLLEDWQYYQHMEDYERADEIEAILLKYHNINMEEDWDYWLEKYNLIQSR